MAVCIPLTDYFGMWELFSAVDPFSTIHLLLFFGTHRDRPVCCMASDSSHDTFCDKRRQDLEKEKKETTTTTPKSLAVSVLLWSSSQVNNVV